MLHFHSSIIGSTSQKNHVFQNYSKKLGNFRLSMPPLEKHNMQKNIHAIKHTCKKWGPIQGGVRADALTLGGRFKAAFGLTPSPEVIDQLID